MSLQNPENFDELKEAFVNLREQFLAHDHSGSNSQPLRKESLDIMIAAISKLGAATADSLVVDGDDSSNGPLYVKNAQVTSSHFKRIMRVPVNGGDWTMWVSIDGTSPNTLLTGNFGDVCFNLSAGGGYMQICVSSPGTSWVKAAWS